MPEDALEHADSLVYPNKLKTMRYSVNIFQ